jgi:hypothetical protein
MKKRNQDSSMKNMSLMTETLIRVRFSEVDSMGVEWKTRNGLIA